MYNNEYKRVNVTCPLRQELLTLILLTAKKNIMLREGLAFFNVF